MTNRSPLGLGVVGAGRFATFVLEAVADLPDVRVAAVTDRDRELAGVLAKAHDAVVAEDADELLAHPDVDVVDHVLRFNPLLAAIGRLQDELVGPPQRFLFENDASDEDLHDDHWFWRAEHSGGILVEHGVHFFDAAAMLLDRPAMSVQATASTRVGTGLTELVTATVRHGDDVLATHTHSFTHAHRCERQLMRLDHGAAESRIEGWIPVDAVIDLWTDDAGVALCEALPARTLDLFAVPGFRLGASARVDVEVHRDADAPAARGRGHDLRIPHHVRLHLTLGGTAAKPAVYAESVRAAMTDLVRAARTGGVPRSGILPGAAATTLALAATEAAEKQHTVNLSGDRS